jgi:deoxyribodipyrimidine photo-lyase
MPADAMSVAHMTNSASNLKFPASRAAALERLQEYLPHVPRYAHERNYVRADHGHVTRLSPAIRHRLISEHEVSATLLRHYSAEHIEKLLQEVWWRLYWKGWLEQRPGVWQEWWQARVSARHGLSSECLEKVAVTEAAESGVAIMDYFARELITTGYLHNHARMWFASFWIHVQRLPWELGAEFFYRHLLDADAASNTLSWRWVAGLQTAGKSYLVRRSNLEKYAADLVGQHPHGLERLADDVVEAVNFSISPSAAREALAPCSSFKMIQQPFALWIHEDDLAVERSALGELAPEYIFLTHDTATHETLRCSPLQRQYKLECLADARDRATHHSTWRKSNVSEILASTDLASTLGELAQRFNLKTIVGLLPMQGALRRQLLSLQQQLDQQHVDLQLPRRTEDESVLNLATAGFFPFWSKIRSSLRERAIP